MTTLHRNLKTPLLDLDIANIPPWGEGECVIADGWINYGKLFQNRYSVNNPEDAIQCQLHETALLHINRKIVNFYKSILSSFKNCKCPAHL